MFKLILKKINNSYRFKVFLSYSAKDKLLAEKIYFTVIDQKMNCFFDEREDLAGEHLPKIIKDNIEDSDCMVTLYTSQGYETKWVHEEVGMAYYAEKEVIVLFEEGVPYSGYETQIGKRAIKIDINEPEPAISNLILNLKRLRWKYRGFWGLFVFVVIWLISRSKK